MRKYTVPVAPSDRLPKEGETIFSRATTPDYKIDAESGCWLWQKTLFPNGYPHGRPYRRYWERANGPVPDAHDVHHVCKNRACVNPEHLEALDRRAHDVEHFLGERAGGITLEDIRAMRELGRQPGVTAAAVAERYGIHEITVYNYWNGTAWADMFDDGPCRPIGRICKRCGDELDPAKPRDAVFCSAKCRSLFNQKAKRQRLAQERAT